MIALGNVRLFEEVQAKTRDLEEALRYQTGSANILNVIASSPTDVQPVLKAIVESACELCEAHDAVVLLKDGDDLCFSAHHGPIPINTEKWPIDRSWAAGRAVIDRATVHVHDLYAEDAGDFHGGRELSQRAGSTAVRSILAAPLLREGESIGAILLRRQEVRPFNNKQIALLQTFADQAVIAHRQRPPVRGSAGPHPRACGNAGISDRDQRHSQRHQPLAERLAARHGHHRPDRQRLCDVRMTR